VNAFGLLLLASAIAMEAVSDAGSAAGPPEPRIGGAARIEYSIGAAAAVERDSLESMVRFLSVDPATGGARTRFALREGPLALVADSLAERLRRYTGAAVERFPFTFDREYGGVDSSYSGENIAARVPGNGAVSGVFLVTAHFDATASRTPGWIENWRTWPAPGADDNATGVAALMEAARVLSGRDLPFDLMFVLFSAEELGLLGSKAFVESLPEIDPGRIIGVLNCDMIGYPLNGYPAGTVVSNPSSDWLAGLVAQAARESDPSFPLAVVSPGPSNSDHAPFWEASIPALMFVEPLKETMLIGSPYYHTLADTADLVDFEQVDRMTRIVVDFIERTAAADAEVSLCPSDVVLLRRGYPVSSRAFSIGDTMTVRVTARNRGSGEVPAGSDMRFSILIENGSLRRTLYSELHPIPAPLDADTAEALVVLDESFLGANTIEATVSVRGMVDDQADNSAEVWLSVEGEEEVVLMHAVQPNPATSGIRAAAFCANLSRGVDIGISLYNLEGELIGTAYAGARWGEPLRAGMNCMPLGELFPSVDRLASGIYFYRLLVYDAGGAAQASYGGRFAVQE
jgi:hypothetical protein